MCFGNNPKGVVLEKVLTSVENSTEKVQIEVVVELHEQPNRPDYDEIIVLEEAIVNTRSNSCVNQYWRKL